MINHEGPSPYQVVGWVRLSQRFVHLASIDLSNKLCCVSLRFCIRALLRLLFSKSKVRSGTLVTLSLKLEDQNRQSDSHIGALLTWQARNVFHGLLRNIIVRPWNLHRPICVQLSEGIQWDIIKISLRAHRFLQLMFDAGVVMRI